MTENRKFFVIIAAYIIILLCIVTIGAAIITKKEANTSFVTVTEKVISTEKIFVWASPPESIPETEAEKDTPEKKLWIVREYEERIGIFSDNGELLDVIDIYTKTLPATDQNLLREGIRISSEQALRAIIEDYSN